MQSHQVAWTLIGKAPLSPRLYDKASCYNFWEMSPFSSFFKEGNWTYEQLVIKPKSLPYGAPSL